MAGHHKYFLYARKSTDAEDRQVRSIDAQLAELRAIASRENLYIVGELIEHQTAKRPGRPTFNSMLDRIERGEADAILAWHPDRLARNSVDGGRIIYLLDTGTIRRLQFFGMSVENTPHGKMMLNTEFGFSKYYVDSLSENTKRGLREKVRRGEYPGRAILGYLNDARTKRIAIDRNRADVVREAFDMYSSGNATIDSIREFFAEHGIRSRPTARFSGGKLLGKSLVSKVLSNPLYYGYFNYGGELHEGVHEPIVSKRIFDKVQLILTKRWKYSPGTSLRTPKPFCQLLKCAECGTAITAEVQKGHTYYRCTKKRRRPNRCTQPYVREEVLDAGISNLLAPFVLPRDWSDELLAQLEVERAHVAQSADAIAFETRNAISSLNTRLTRLKEALLDELIDHEEFRADKAELLSKKKTLNEELAALTRGETSWLEPFEEWLNTATQLGKTLEKSTSKDKQALAKKVFGSNLVLHQKKPHGKAVEPWPLIPKTVQSLTVARLYEDARTYFKGAFGAGMRQ